MNHQKIGIEFLGQYQKGLKSMFDLIQYTPGFIMIDNIMCRYYDVYMDSLLKAYYWPAFVAGNADDWTALMRMDHLRTNLCKPY